MSSVYLYFNNFGHYHCILGYILNQNFSFRFPQDLLTFDPLGDFCEPCDLIYWPII